MDSVDLDPVVNFCMRVGKLREAGRRWLPEMGRLPKSMAPCEAKQPLKTEGQLHAAKKGTKMRTERRRALAA